MNTNSMNGVGVPVEKCQNSNTAALDNAIHLSVSLLLNMMYTVLANFFTVFAVRIFFEISKIVIVTFVDPVCHVYHLSIKPVPLGNYRQGFTRTRDVYDTNRKHLVLIRVPNHDGEQVPQNGRCKRQAKEWS